MATSSTDIVERLRSPRPDAHPLASAAQMGEIDRQRREAADEIERLRDENHRSLKIWASAEKEIERLRAALRSVVDANNQSDLMRAFRIAREALDE